MDESIAYTSGTGSIFKSGIPVGKVRKESAGKDNNQDKILIEFYSDFTQIKYVFAEIEKKTNNNEIENKLDGSEVLINIEKIKLDLLNENKEILEESNLKYIEELEKLKLQINELDNKIIDYKKKIAANKEIINQNENNKEELEFLRLNLIYSSKCNKTFFNNGFKVGTKDYKNCILSRGKNK